MSINEALKKITLFLKNHLNWVFVSLWVIVIAWLVYFTYQNYYLTIYLPKAIPDNEIIAKKQKVNINLFNQINDKIKLRNSVNSANQDNFKNPFL